MLFPPPGTGDVDQDKTCGTLKVTVLTVDNLEDGDWFGGESDPFVTLQLEPRAPKEAHHCRRMEYAETRVKNGAGRRAQFNETFAMPVFRTTTGGGGKKNGKSKKRLGNRRLRVTVKDKDPRFLTVGSDDVLGTAVSRGGRRREEGERRRKLRRRHL